MTEIHVELLLGTKVRDVDGEDIGRIEELRVERDDKALLVEAYLIGTSALIERLSAWTLVRPIQRFLNGRKLWITNAAEADLFIVFAMINP